MIRDVALLHDRAAKLYKILRLAKIDNSVKFYWLYFRNAVAFSLSLKLEGYPHQLISIAGIEYLIAALPLLESAGLAINPRLLYCFLNYFHADVLAELGIESIFADSIVEIAIDLEDIPF